MQSSMVWYQPQLNYFFTQYGFTIPQSANPSPDPSQNETYSNINSDQWGSQANYSYSSTPLLNSER